MSDILIVQVTAIVCGTIMSVTAIGFLRRYLELRHERRGSLPDETAARLQRIEHTVESTAIEVERISEANRFLSKLLTERTGPPNTTSSPPRVITPH